MSGRVTLGTATHQLHFDTELDYLCGLLPTGMLRSTTGNMDSNEVFLVYISRLVFPFTCIENYLNFVFIFIFISHTKYQKNNLKYLTIFVIS